MTGTGLLKRTTSYLLQLLRFIGPGFMVAVGYFDPGNWATNMEGGSEFGYRLLFIVLFSNVIAVFLQNLTIRLGTVTGLDLASCSRRYLHRYLNLFLYVLAEIAIITTDMAEVIGSAIALTLLIPALPLPASVAITVIDVFIILMFYKDDPSETDTSSMRVIRYFELFVMLLVAAVGICITIILVYSETVAIDVLKGYIPSKAIFTSTDCLYVAIGIIGATVMPHNLYLHSFIVQSRTREWREKRPGVVEDEPDNWVIQDPGCQMITSSEKDPDTLPVIIETGQEPSRMDESGLRHYLKTQVGINLHYGFVDLVVALLFAFYVNSAILTVAGANFYYTPNPVPVNDLFGASQLLSDYLGPAAGKVFALALLGSGQSSTITATLSGQVVMSGFLGLSTRPWVRRFITRLVAIIPALIAACSAGRSGLNQLLVASQVALSIQLPFAVVPLIYFTSRKTIMKLDLVVSVEQEKKRRQDASPKRLVIPWIDRIVPTIHIRWPQFLSRVKNNEEQLERDDSTTVPSTSTKQATTTPIALSQWPSPIQYENHKVVIVIASLVSILLIGLNGYVVVSLFDF